MNQQDLQILFLASGLTSSINLLLDQLSQKTVDTEYVRFLAEHLESCLVGVQKKMGTYSILWATNSKNLRDTKTLIRGH